MPLRCSYGRTNGRVRDGRRIRPHGPVLHIGELEAQRGDAASGQCRSGSDHERMGHPGTRAVGQDKTCLGRIRNVQQAGDDPGLIHLDGETVRLGGFAVDAHGVAEFRNFTVARPRGGTREFAL
jgi:hypothetical protein